MPAAEPPDFVFSKKCFEAHRGEVQLHMSHFFLRYLHDIYQAFRGDLTLAIVLGEISHHNTAKFFSPDQTASEALRELHDKPAQWARMEGCNAYSLSCATGIPRETVRRKVAELKRRGWVEDVPEHGLRITRACVDHFGADYSLRFLNGMLRASRHIEALLAEDDGERPRLSGRPSAPPPSRPAGSKAARRPRLPNQSKQRKP